MSIGLVHFQVAAELSQAQGISKVLVAQNDVFHGFLPGMLLCKSKTCEQMIVKANFVITNTVINSLINF